MSRRERRRLAKLAAGGAAPSNVVPFREPGELGVTGTINWSGQIYAEANSKLQWEKAYGQPGSTAWGEWEKLERTDHQVASALNLTTAPLRDSVAEVEAVSDSEEDIRIADFVRDNIQQWLEPRVAQLIEQQARYGLAYGFHLGELVWGTRPDERVPGGLAVYLRKVAQRLPSSVAINGWLEADGELAHVKQQGYRDGRWTTILLPADKLLLCTWARSGNNYQGFSAFRSVWYLAQVRAELLRIIAIGHQRESLGVPVAEQDINAPLDADQRSVLQRILENLVAHEAAGIQLPPGVKMNWVFSPGANKGHVLESWRAFGLAILEVVQAQQQYLGTSDTGSRAVGGVHAAAQNSFVQGVRAWLEAAWNGIGAQPYTGVIRKLVDANFGPRRAYPVFRLVTKKAELEPQALAAAIVPLKQAGALTWTADDENDVRERLGLRPVDAGQRAGEDAGDVLAVPGAAGAAGAAESVQDTALNGAQVEALLAIIAAVVAGQMPRDTALQIIVSAFQVPPERADKLLGSVGRGFTPEAVGERAGAEDALTKSEPLGGGTDGEEAPGAPTGAASLSPGRATGEGKTSFSGAAGPAGRDVSRASSFTPRRALREEEKILALTEIAGFLDEARDTAAEALAKAVRATLRGLLPTIGKAMEDGNPDELAGLKVAVKPLAEVATSAAEKASAYGYAQSAKEKERGTKKVEEARKDGEPGVEGAAPAKLAAKKERRAPREKVLTSHAATTANRVAGRIKSEVMKEATRAAQRGESPETVITKVVSTFSETRVLHGEAGGLVNAAFGVGRSKHLEENEREVESVFYSAILDEEVCSSCKKEDGKTFELWSQEHLEHETPYDKCKSAKGADNLCRCLLVPQWKK